MTTKAALHPVKSQRATGMLWFKQCPKCEGDLYQDRDMYGPFVSCLQCGYYLTDGQMKMILTTGTLHVPAQETREREVALVA
ncbi:MAG: hypothetical protein HY681_04015 [Chloroflexi bacterium]|nr:hypothetical protein [Chloroflexota bacterium]